MEYAQVHTPLAPPTSTYSLMYEQPDAPAHQEDTPIKIRIMQINLNKSERAHLDIINERVSQKYNIMLIQELYTMAFNAIRTLANFRPIFPRSRPTNDSQVRSVIWVNEDITLPHIFQQNLPDSTGLLIWCDKGQFRMSSLNGVHQSLPESMDSTRLCQTPADSSRP